MFDEGVMGKLMMKCVGSYYVFDDVFGCGFMGMVWCGYDFNDGFFCVIKIFNLILMMDKGVIWCFIDECDIFMFVDDDVVVWVIDMVVEFLMFVIVMELVDGLDFV